MAMNFADESELSDGSDKPLLSPPAALFSPQQPVLNRLTSTLARPGKFQRRLLAFAGTTQLADAMELTMIAFLAGEIKCPWGLSKGDMALLQTLVLIGMGIGSNVTGWVSDRFGRKPATALSIVAAALGGVAAVFSPNFGFLIVCRTIVGCGVGAAPAALTLYTDFLPVPDAGVGNDSDKNREHRGRKLILFFSFFSIGAILESLVAWATLSTPSLGWRGLLAVSAVPSVLLAMGLPWVPESPRWLLDRGDLDQATTILDRVERINSGVASAVDRDGPPQSLNAREHEPQKTEQELRSRARPPSEAMFETSQESDAFSA